MKTYKLTQNISFEKMFEINDIENISLVTYLISGTQWLMIHYIYYLRFIGLRGIKIP